MGLISKLMVVFVTLSGIAMGTESLDKLPIIPLIPLVPAAPNIEIDNTSKEEVGEQEEVKSRVLEKIDTVMLPIKTSVYVPLEIISDVEIEATLIDDQEITIPFNVETNKKPEKKDYYKLKFSENEIDIDKDGAIDTYLYSSKYINSKILDGNYVNIKGSGISTEGNFYKKIYLTVEVE